MIDQLVDRLIDRLTHSWFDRLSNVYLVHVQYVCYLFACEYLYVRVLGIHDILICKFYTLFLYEILCLHKNN